MFLIMVNVCNSQNLGRCIGSNYMMLMIRAAMDVVCDNLGLQKNTLIILFSENLTFVSKNSPLVFEAKTRCEFCFVFKTIGLCKVATKIQKFN